MERRIGKYAIKKKLGQGAFGQVYLVVDAQGRKYAAKVMQMSR
jgi:serine/threonine protein kinase